MRQSNLLIVGAWNFDAFSRERREWSALRGAGAWADCCSVNALEVAVLSPADGDALADLRRLLPQVSSNAPELTAERLAAVLAWPGTHIVTARLDERIVGMALLVVSSTLAGDFGTVEEVAVDEDARGRHVGVHLMVRLLAHAADLGLRFVDLTSRESRVEANALYRKLGFARRETNCYRHDLVSLPAAW